MNKNNLLLIVTLISLFISLILAIFLVTVKTKLKLSNSLFALFLTITSCDIVEPVFNTLVDGPSNIGMLRSIFAFLQIPIFYLYVVSVCYSDFKLQPKHLLHILPFLVVNAIFTPRFYAVDLASKIDFITNRLDMIELKFTHIFFHIQVVIYIVAIFMLL